MKNFIFTAIIALAAIACTCNDKTTDRIIHSSEGSWEQFRIMNPDTVLHLNVSEYIAGNRSKIFYADCRGGFSISFSLLCNTLGTEQAFLSKHGKGGDKEGDISVGYDNTMGRIFVETKDTEGKLHRIPAGDAVKSGEWYDVKVDAVYDPQDGETSLTLAVKARHEEEYQTNTVTYGGYAIPYNVGQWIVGHGCPGGFPNSLQVRDGYISNLSITTSGIARKDGENPIFPDRFTADPACLVVGDRVYAYVGEDQAVPGGWFTMPHWLCYSTDDMINWTYHGPVLKAGDFPYANPNGAWAAQVVEKDGKYYFYVTLDDLSNGEHTIDVAVGDSPLGPFVPARKDGTPLITDGMTPDSHRPNADIDPTVLIDDDGTPWMAWGNGDCYMVKLKDNMIELDSEVRKVPLRNYSEGPWLFKRKGLYYNVYAADAPGVQPEQMAYSYAPAIEGPWTYGGLLTGSAKYGFTIHPSVIEFKGDWYFFYHDGSYMLDGEPGGDCRRRVCVEYLHFEDDGTIRPITLTTKGIRR